MALVSPLGRERQNYCHLAPRKDNNSKGEEPVEGALVGSLPSALLYEKLLSFAQHKNRNMPGEPRIERDALPRLRLRLRLHPLYPARTANHKLTEIHTTTWPFPHPHFHMQATGCHGRGREWAGLQSTCEK